MMKSKDLQAKPSSRSAGPLMKNHDNTHSPRPMQCSPPCGGALPAYTGRQMSQKIKSSYLVYFLPSLHLVGCAVCLLTHDLEFMIKADLPVSIIFVGLAYSGVNPLVGLAVFGTLWWYVFSLVIRSVVRTIVRTFNLAKSPPE